MWPYSGKKSFAGGGGGGGVNLELFGSNQQPQTNRQNSNLDKEYFKQISMALNIGMASYPTHKVDNEGRVIRQYGVDTEDVTEKFCSEGARPASRKSQANVPDRQLHSKNVTQLKVVLDMPEKQRRTSLTQVAGAIMRNEIIPTKSQLENNEFLNNQLKKSTDIMVNHVLPPLKQNSFVKANRIEHFFKLRLTKAQHENKQRTNFMNSKSDENVESNLPLPSISGRQGNTKEECDEYETKMFNKMKQKRPTSLLLKRKSSRPLFYSRENTYTTDDGEDDTYMESKRYEKNDSADSIREQFRQIVQEQLAKSDATRGATAGNGNNGGDVELNVSGGLANKNVNAQNNLDRKTTSGYKLRHEYGKNLEKNWFRSFMKKGSKSKRGESSVAANNCDLRLDIFYSPEPQSDGELNNSDNSSNEDDASIQCGGFSTATAESRSRRRGRTSMRFSTSMFIQDNTLVERDEELNDVTSESDIEIILKDDQLIQRKTKHKMKKKRQRQMKRYKAFFPQDIKPVHEQIESDTVPLTDQEIRALRLNLRNKERLKKLKGKRKFLQAANAVYIAVQFKNILKKIRNRKRRIIKERQQRIAAMVQSKRGRWKDKANDTYEQAERQSTPKPTLKEQFMNEIGNRLILEVEQLNICHNLVTKCVVTKSDTEGDEDEDEIPITSTPASAPKLYELSKFEIEIRKVSLKDVEEAYTKKTRHVKPQRLIKRRNSVPKTGRPMEFCFEIPEKSKRRKERIQPGGNKQHVKELRSNQVSPVPKCSCIRHKQTDRSNLPTKNQNKCQHQTEIKKPKMKVIRIPTSGLMRTYSLDDLRKKKPLELRDLLREIDMPAKEIKLQILDRKFRRQRKKRLQIRLSACRLRERIEPEPEVDSGSETDANGSDDSDGSDYDFVYGAPFVGSGVMWNQNSNKAKQLTWTSEDVDREVKRITRIFHEMKECKYLRHTGLNEAIVERLNENNFSK